MLHRLPRRLQQQPMLRVQQPGLTGRDAEERRVEPRYVVDEARPARHHLPGCAGLRVEEFIGVPTILGNLRYGVPSLAQHLPESVGVRSARKACCVADDRKARWRLLRMPCHRRCPPCSVPTGQPALPTASPNRRTTLLAVARFCKSKISTPAGGARDRAGCTGVTAGKVHSRISSVGRARYSGIVAAGPEPSTPRRGKFCASGKSLSAPSMNGR